MTFEERRNRFKERLDSGSFFALLEIPSPSRKVELQTAVSRISEMAETAANVEGLSVSLAFTDKSKFSDSWNVAEFATALCPNNRDNHVIYISGRESSLDNMLDTLKLCGAAGFWNLVPVSGDAVPGEDAKATMSHRFTEGIHLLNQIGTIQKNPFFPGCPVNPFKYTPDDMLAQYYKLIKKLNQGAGFLVTQFGWDMMKLQELRWYLNCRGLHYPSIARILVMSPEHADNILAGRMPGVPISPDFRAILEREVKLSGRQFESAQWRRLQIQAAGCKLLGYSAVQVAGLENASQVRIACKQIADALLEFRNFEEWRDAYQEHMSKIEMAPYPYRFYMFEKLFSQAHPETAPRMKDIALRPCSGGERFNYKLSRFLFSHANRQLPDEHLISKKILVGCKRCSYCRLPLTHYLCPERCPKGLANGPCGGTQADGSCEVSDNECLHARHLRLALLCKDGDSLEEKYIKPAEKI